MKASFDPAFRTESIALAERSGYRRGRGQDPIATLAALGLVAAMVGACLFTAPTFIHKQKPETIVVNLQALPDDPPPPEQPDPQPRPEVTPPKTPVVAPPPEVTLPNVPSPVTAAPQPVPVAPAAPPAPKGAVAIAPAAPSDGGELSTKVLVAKPPRYPVDSRRQREEGTVVLGILLSTEGNVADISVVKSSGFFRLDRAALDAVRGWRWQPLIRNGAAVMVRGVVTIPFVLQRGGDRDDHHGRRHGRDREDDRDRDGDSDFQTT